MESESAKMGELASEEIGFHSGSVEAVVNVIGALRLAQPNGTEP